jgi:hypothetical protein
LIYDAQSLGRASKLTHDENIIMSLPTPSRPTADRNLLFGILALQMDFIGRDALIVAMNAWVLDKAKPLGQILLEQAALRLDTHALLEALVQKHLELHGGDAEKSLAAVSSVGSVRQELEQIVDDELRASLVHVSAARSADSDPFATRRPRRVRPLLPVCVSASCDRTREADWARCLWPTIRNCTAK